MPVNLKELPKTPLEFVNKESFTKEVILFGEGAFEDSKTNERPFKEGTNSSEAYNAIRDYLSEGGVLELAGFIVSANNQKQQSVAIMHEDKSEDGLLASLPIITESYFLDKNEPKTFIPYAVNMNNRNRTRFKFPLGSCNEYKIQLVFKSVPDVLAPYIR